MRALELHEAAAISGGDDGLYQGIGGVALVGGGVKVATGLGIPGSGAVATGTLATTGPVVVAGTMAFAGGLMIGTAIEEEWGVGTWVGTQVGNALGSVGIVW